MKNFFKISALCMMTIILSFICTGCSNNTLINIKGIELYVANVNSDREYEITFLSIEIVSAMSIDNSAHLGEIVDELKKYGTVTVDANMCIICVVGDLDWSNIGFETRVMDALKTIPVRMISYGGSNYNISFLIKEEDKKRALQSLSDNLFNA